MKKKYGEAGPLLALDDLQQLAERINEWLEDYRSFCFCINCRYWDNWDRDNTRDHPCKHAKMVSVDGNSKYKIDKDELASTYKNSTITTGPNFSCVHFEWTATKP